MEESSSIAFFFCPIECFSKHNPRITQYSTIVMRSTGNASLLACSTEFWLMPRKAEVQFHWVKAESAHAATSEFFA